MNQRAFNKIARVLSVAGAITASPVDKPAPVNSRGAQTQNFDPAALKQFQEILGYPEERFESFLQRPPSRKIILQIKDIAKNNILLEVLKKTL